MTVALTVPALVEELMLILHSPPPKQYTLVKMSRRPYMKLTQRNVARHSVQFVRQTKINHILCRVSCIASTQLLKLVLYR